VRLLFSLPSARGAKTQPSMNRLAFSFVMNSDGGYLRATVFRAEDGHKSRSPAPVHRPAPESSVGSLDISRWPLTVLHLKMLAGGNCAQKNAPAAPGVIQVCTEGRYTVVDSEKDFLVGLASSNGLYTLHATYDRGNLSLKSEFDLESAKIPRQELHSSVQDPGGFPSSVPGG